MPTKPLSAEICQLTVDIYHKHQEVSAAAREAGVPRNTFASRLSAARDLGYLPTVEYADLSPIIDKLRELKPPFVLYVTSAQNATPVHDGHRAAVRRFCEHRNAHLVVIPYRYRNPTSVWTNNQGADEHWAKSIQNDLLSEDVELNENLLLAARIKTQPTRLYPLNRMETYSGSKSAIFGHAKQSLKSVATPQNALPKLLWSTGSITIKNYTDTTTGIVQGEHHHIIGGLVVEVVDDSHFYVRQVNAYDDGSFYDLNTLYRSRDIKEDQNVKLIRFGDIHHAVMDPVAAEATFGEGGLVDRLKPEFGVVDDVLDFRSQNHHDISNFFERFRKWHEGQTSVYREVKETLQWLSEQSSKFQHLYVVKSNHDEAFTKYLNRSAMSGCDDPENAWFFHATMSGILPDPESDSCDVLDPLVYWYRQWHSEDNVHFLQRDEPFIVDDIDNGHHGDIGANGSRGSTREFNKIGVRSTIAHAHAPEQIHGVFRTGVMQLDMNYAVGPSSWFISHVIQYPGGKRAHVHLVDGKFFMEKGKC